MPEPSHYPTAQQQRILWSALTAGAIVLICGVIAFACYLGMQIVSLLYPVLLPLGFAMILSFIFDPVLDLLEQRRIPRWIGIWILFFGLILAFALVVLYIVPPLAREIMQFIDNLPSTITSVQAWYSKNMSQYHTYLDKHEELKNWLDNNLEELKRNAPNQISGILKSAWAPFSKFFSWIGFVIGFLFVPLYVYYFLVERHVIVNTWSEYVPIQHSRVREEVVVVISEINNYLVIFFRGQVIVGAILGTLTAIGLSLIGLQYALLIGLAAGVLSLIPYLGLVSSLIPALLIAYATADPADHYSWLFRPLAVGAVFAVVQFLEGTFISPRIMGERTGLHPLTVILGILVWSLILPGLLGPILAVPLTATLRVLMYRYIWRKSVPEATVEAVAGLSSSQSQTPPIGAIPAAVAGPALSATPAAPTPDVTPAPSETKTP